MVLFRHTHARHVSKKTRRRACARTSARVRWRGFVGKPERLRLRVGAIPGVRPRELITRADHAS
eukprot:5989369-Pleurochrysis_carterae.AAC.1